MDYRVKAIKKMYEPQDADLEDKGRAALQGLVGDVSIIPAGLGAAAGNIVGREGDNEARFQALKAKLGIREPVKEEMSAFSQGVLDEDAKNKAALEKYPVISNAGMAAGFVTPGGIKGKVNFAKMTTKEILEYLANKSAANVVDEVPIVAETVKKVVTKLPEEVTKVTSNIPKTFAELSPALQNRIDTINKMPISKEEASKLIKDEIRSAYGAGEAIRDVKILKKIK